MLCLFTTDKLVPWSYFVDMSYRMHRRLETTNIFLQYSMFTRWIGTMAIAMPLSIIAYPNQVYGCICFIYTTINRNECHVIPWEWNNSLPTHLFHQFNSNPRDHERETQSHVCTTTTKSHPQYLLNKHITLLYNNYSVASDDYSSPLPPPQSPLRLPLTYYLRSYLQIRHHTCRRSSRHRTQFPHSLALVSLQFILVTTITLQNNRSDRMEVVSLSLQLGQYGKIFVFIPHPLPLFITNMFLKLNGYTSVAFCSSSVSP